MAKKTLLELVRERRAKRRQASSFQVDFQPSYEQIGKQTAESLSSTVATGATDAGLTTLSAGLKTLDIPRIVTTDVLGNVFEAIFEAGFDLLDGRGSDAVAALGRNFIEIFTDTYGDIFTTDLETTRSGTEVADEYYQLFGTSYAEVSPWVRWIPSIGFELLQDPTTFIGAGAVKTGLKSLGVKLAKRMSDDVAKATIKYFARMKAIANDTDAKMFLSDVLSAKTTDEQMAVMEKLTEQFGLKDVVKLHEQQIGDNLAATLAEQMARPESQQVLGFYVNIHDAFGKLNKKSAVLGAEYVQRVRSGYDDVLEKVAGFSDDKLRMAGFSDEQIKALRNPLSFEGRTVRNVKNLSAVDLRDRANILGIDMQLKNVGDATADEILAASRKYGGEIQFYDDMFDSNPQANFWAFSNDLNAVMKNPNVYIQNVRSANNFARALGVGWYSNPFWWLGRVYKGGKSLVTDPRRAIGSLYDKRTYATLFGRTSHPVAQTITDVMSDPLMGADPRSANWIERQTGNFMFHPNAPEFAAISDDAIQTTQVAYAMTTERASDTLIRHGQTIMDYVSRNGSGEFVDAIQFTALQRGALKAARDAGHTNPQQLTKLVEQAKDGQFEDDLLESLGITRDQIAERAAEFRNDESAQWVKDIRGLFDEVLDLERSFDIGSERLTDSTEYFPIMLQNEFYQAIEKELDEAGLGDLIATVKSEISDNLANMVSGKLRMRNLRNMSINMLNDYISKGKSDALRELGILDAFLSGSAAETLAIQNAVIKAIDTTLERGLKPFATNPADVIAKRVRHHYQNSIMNVYYGMLEKAGYVKRYEYGQAGAVAKAKLQRAAKRLGLDVDEAGNQLPFEQVMQKMNDTEIRRALSTTKTGTRYFVFGPAEQRARELGYLTSEDGWAWNIAPADFDAVFGDTRNVIVEIGGKQMSYDRVTNRVARSSLANKSAERLYSIEKKIAKTERLILEQGDTAKAKERVDKLKSELDRLRSEREAMTANAPEKAMAAYQAVARDIRNRVESGAEFAKFEDLPSDFKQSAIDFFDISSVGKAAPIYVGEDAIDLFHRLEGITKDTLPTPQLDHQLAVSRKSLVQMIQRLESSVDLSDKELAQELYELLNKANPGFAILSNQNVKNIMTVANAAARTGVGDAIVQLPTQVLMDMSKLNVNIRALKDVKPNMLVRTARTIFGPIQKAALWGVSVMQANLLGNALYAAQGGISANVASHVKAIGLYLIVQSPRRLGPQHLLDIAPEWARNAYRKAVDAIDPKLSGADRDAFLGRELKKLADSIHIRELNMSLGELMDKFEAAGVTQGWVRQFYESLDAGKLGRDWSRKVETSIAKQPWWSKLHRGMQRALSMAGMATSFVADDSWRFVFAYDAMVNRGYTFDEAAQMTKQYFGDFNQIKTAKLDRAFQDWVFFYRFKKWNAIQQARVLARDPKWANFTAKIMRTYRGGSTPEELAVAQTSPLFSAPEFSIARKDETGDTWDSNGNLMRSKYAVFNPLGSWFVPADSLQWLNPMRSAWESVIISGDVDPSGSGIIKSMISGFDSLYESFGIDNPERKAELRMRAMAHFCNTNRIMRYIKPAFTGNEQWWRETQERLTRTTYKKYLSLQETISNARKEMKDTDPAVEENARILHRLDRLYYQLQTLKRRRMDEIRPFDYEE